MSRVGRLPIEVPSGVDVSIQGSNVKVKGPKGELQRTFSPLIGIKMEDGVITVSRNSEAPSERALHGTTRAILANMVHGVNNGFEIILEIEGVGYRAEMNGDKLVLNLGFSHPVELDPPHGISFDADGKLRQIKIMGYDKEQVGQIASEIRNLRPPEPYHGKGLRYAGERIRRKAGKAGKGGV
ncbi:MAG: 50S ribosomal protein L6 [Anaerolineales bacterium]|nr:50S ribosomal protein L6 [Anaerolineales bacterium]